MHYQRPGAPKEHDMSFRILVFPGVEEIDFIDTH